MRKNMSFFAFISFKIEKDGISEHKKRARYRDMTEFECKVITRERIQNNPKKALKQAENK